MCEDLDKSKNCLIFVNHTKDKMKMFPEENPEVEYMDKAYSLDKTVESCDALSRTLMHLASQLMRIELASCAQDCLDSAVKIRRAATVVTSLLQDHIEGYDNGRN